MHQQEQHQQAEKVVSNGVGGGGNNGGSVSGKRVREEGASAVSAGGGGLGAGEGARGQRGPGELLVLTSACPGWVCYAEKTAPEALPFMSTVKSPQQVRVPTLQVVSTRPLVVAVGLSFQLRI